MNAVIFGVVAALALSPVSRAASEADDVSPALPLDNANFQANSGANPDGWMTQESGDTIYVWGNGTGGLPPGERVLAFKVSPGEMYVQQSFPFTRVRAGECGRYTVSFDTGWRNNTADTDMTFVVSLMNPSNRQVLGSAMFRMPADAGAFNRYRPTGRQSLVIHYDHRQESLADAPLALRIAAVAPSGDGTMTAWVDNVTVTARKIPEPATCGLMAAALGGVACVVRRRRS